MNDEVFRLLKELLYMEESLTGFCVAYQQNDGTIDTSWVGISHEDIQTGAQMLYEESLKDEMNHPESYINRPNS